MTEFFLPMIPPTVTAQEHKIMVKNGKPIFYDPPQVKDAKSKLLSALCPHKPKEPYKYAVRLTCKWLSQKTATMTASTALLNLTRTISRKCLKTA